MVRIINFKNFTRNGLNILILFRLIGWFVGWLVRYVVQVIWVSHRMIRFMIYFIFICTRNIAYRQIGHQKWSNKNNKPVLFINRLFMPSIISLHCWPYNYIYRYFWIFWMNNTCNELSEISKSMRQATWQNAHPSLNSICGSFVVTFLLNISQLVMRHK